MSKKGKAFYLILFLIFATFVAVFVFVYNFDKSKSLKNLEEEVNRIENLVSSKKLSIQRILEMESEYTVYQELGKIVKVEQEFGSGDSYGKIEHYFLKDGNLIAVHGAFNTVIGRYERHHLYFDRGSMVSESHQVNKFENPEEFENMPAEESWLELKTSGPRQNVYLKTTELPFYRIIKYESETMPIPMPKTSDAKRICLLR